MKASVDLVDSLELFRSGISGPDIRQVGTDPVWEDDSEATYVDVVGKFFGASNPAFFSRAEARLAPQSFARTSSIRGDELGLRFRIDVRLKTLQAGTPFPTVRFVAANSTFYTPTSVPSAAPTTPTTVTLEMTGFGTAWGSPEDYRISIRPRSPSPVPGTTGNYETRNWYIYEVRPYWWLPSREAPPCRIFPRDDGLGVGAGRQFPAPRSQQRGGRWVGYY